MSNGENQPGPPGPPGPPPAPPPGPPPQTGPFRKQAKDPLKALEKRVAALEKALTATPAKKAAPAKKTPAKKAAAKKP